jgi:ferredoxin
MRRAGHGVAIVDIQPDAVQRVAKEELLMRVVVDRAVCESNALCVAAAPEVFEVRDEDLLFVLNESPPEVLRNKVEAAARVCPKQAIKIED